MKRLLLPILFLLLIGNCYAANEDLTTYTNAANLDVTSSNISWIRTDIPTYSYKDYGAAYFGATFTHYTEYLTTYQYSPSSDLDGVFVWAVSDTTEANHILLNAADKGLALNYDQFGGWGIYIWNYNGDGWDKCVDASTLVNNHTYVTVIGSGGTVTGYFYSDASRETLIDSIAVNYSDTYRYISAIGQGATDDVRLDGDIYNFDIGETAAETILLGTVISES